MYKSDISLKFYITFLPMKLRTVFSRFRCRNHKLPVETGIYINIPRSERVCVKCTQSEIGDEFHYIFNCPFFADQRRTYLPKYCHIHPSAPKFKRIMNDKTKLRSLANFIKIILESVKWKNCNWLYNNVYINMSYNVCFAYHIHCYFFVFLHVRLKE